MIEDLLVWMLAAYGCSSLLVTLLRWFKLRPFAGVGESFVHYQVLLYNSEHSLESVVRRLMNTSVLHGTPIQISLIDYGSTDDTLKISAVLERRDFVFTADANPDTKKHPITIDLRRSEEQESR